MCRVLSTLLINTSHHFRRQDIQGFLYKPSTYVSFSDQNVYVFHRFIKLFIIQFLLDKYRNNFNQIRHIKFFGKGDSGGFFKTYEMKGHALFQGEMINV